MIKQIYTFAKVTEFGVTILSVNVNIENSIRNMYSNICMLTVIRRSHLLGKYYCVNCVMLLGQSEADSRAVNQERGICGTHDGGRRAYIDA